MKKLIVLLLLVAACKKEKEEMNVSVITPKVSPSAIGQQFTVSTASADWTTEGAGTTWSFNANSIGSVGTGGTYSSLIRYNKKFIQCENFTIKALVTVNSVASTSTVVYLGIGLQGVSVASQKVNFNCAFWCDSGSTKGYQELYYFETTDGSNLVANSGANRLALTQGDQIEYMINCNKNVINFSIRNVTQNTAYQTVTYTNSTAITSPGAATTNLPNINQLAIYNYKGDYTINSITFINNEQKNIYLTCVGDSKSEGYYVTSFANRFSNLIALARNKVVQVSAGSGNRTADIVNAMPEILEQKPKYVVLFIGRNDIASGVAEATWQANYANITQQLTQAGVRVFHQLPTPEGSLDQSALTTYINATYKDVIPVPTGWVVGTHCSADAVHFSVAGAALMSTNILQYLPSN